MSQRRQWRRSVQRPWNIPFQPESTKSGRQCWNQNWKRKIFLLPFIRSHWRIWIPLILNPCMGLVQPDWWWEALNLLQHGHHPQQFRDWQEFRCRKGWSVQNNGKAFEKSDVDGFWDCLRIRAVPMPQSNSGQTIRHLVAVFTLRKLEGKQEQNESHSWPWSKSHFANDPLHLHKPTCVRKD